MSKSSELCRKIRSILEKRGRKSNRDKEAERELALEDNQKADADGLSLISMKRTQYYGAERPVFGVLQDDGTTKGTIYAFDDSDGRQRLMVEYKGKKKVISSPNTITPISYVTKGQIKQAIEFINSLD